MSPLRTAQSLVDGARALEIVRDAMAAYTLACDEGKWDQTECLRARVHDALDAYFDHYAAAIRNK